MSEENDKQRIAKRMSQLGLCSRREAEKLIEKGLVFVDGVMIKEPSTKVSLEQNISISAEAEDILSSRASIMIHKPVGYVSAQAEDNYRAALELLTADNFYGTEEGHDVRNFNNKLQKSFAPAGRLDIDSKGLLILTQDGSLAKKIIHKDFQIDKEYLVRTNESISDEQLQKLRHGLSLDGEKLLPAIIERIDKDFMKMILKEGKKRQIRRMCELLGLNVIGLKRVRIGPIQLGDLPTGKWRYLSDEEIQQIKSF